MIANKGTLLNPVEKEKTGDNRQCQKSKWSMETYCELVNC